MSDKRLNTQLDLAFPTEARGEAPRAAEGVTESLAANRRAESPGMGAQLMEAVCEWSNIQQAVRRVKRNHGSAGVDGMTVHQVPAHLKQHWPTLRAHLLGGTYRPQPVKRVEIPKPEGGTRLLGIPTVLDRVIQ
jgi:RNA-directed DNA polymerase